MAKRKFEKQILRLGKWLHPAAPGGVLDISSDYLKTIVKNFSHSPFSPVVRGHVESAEADKNPALVLANNISKLNIKADGLYAEFEIEEAELQNYNDVSVSIEPDYINHETGENIGALLKHVALVTNPFIKGLKQFVALHDKPQLKIYLSEIQNMQETVQQDQATEVIVDEAKVDAVVEETAVETAVEATPEVVEEIATSQEPVEIATETISNEIVEEAAVVEEQNPETINASESLLTRIAALEATNKQLSVQLSQSKAEKMYDVLLTDGKIVPAQRDAFVRLAAVSGQSINLADGSNVTVEALLSDLFEKAPKVISFGEQGINVEAGDSSESIPSIVLEDLKKMFPKMNPSQLSEYAIKNRNSLMGAYKSKTK